MISEIFENDRSVIKCIVHFSAIFFIINTLNKFFLTFEKILKNRIIQYD